MLAPMEILLASSNAHKLAEIRALFPCVDVRAPAEAGVSAEVEEDCETFLENAMKKARTLASRSGLPILADDSGICVDALGGRPGIRSARYGSEDGRPLSSEERNALLLGEMDAVEDRSCRFVCALVLLFPDGRLIAVQEAMEGSLLRAPRGRGGFGYDPVVFFPPLGKSVAELSEDEKNAHSHRGRAVARLRAALAALDG